ncbi:hypothetical protein HII36_17150 [Nonomuraea sp. NN258]|uniref:hypothetical protein n=1 Tax=Nonomuraea antri TaxID=2730852 RepID=UPI0015699E90|nr:hypothetical protein [Nonomuraea antri]NRQ33564.1 hypothetical protein [Nonomuraea antri]
MRIRKAAATLATLAAITVAPLALNAAPAAAQPVTGAATALFEPDPAQTGPETTDDDPETFGAWKTVAVYGFKRVCRINGPILQRTMGAKSWRCKRTGFSVLYKLQLRW